MHACVSESVFNFPDEPQHAAATAARKRYTVGRSRGFTSDSSLTAWARPDVSSKVGQRSAEVRGGIKDVRGRQKHEEPMTYMYKEERETNKETKREIYL